MTGMTTERCLAAIETWSRALADSARGNLSARVEHCPDWDVADLVWHVTGVQWFWARIAEQLPQEMPRHLLEEENRPARPESEDELLALFDACTRDLLQVLEAADQSAACWTWAPQKDVAFITRHQVQEAMVHAWDAANAAGHRLTLDPAAAADAVEEFLTVSVSTAADPAEPPRPALDGALWACACAGSEGPSPTWLVTDGPTPGTVAWQRVPDRVDPADLVEGVALVGGHTDPVVFLLWLYGRAADPFEGGASGDTDVLGRFRALTYTD